ncbi:hypothetical protein TSOC_009832 [Tetrabaena socialis]|uniref:Uncharacterized protein n=1 Tax=Tetrabaena socialis TaxID=47790 RepID=A0A2J7ZUV6_9CHLO|nr:hypothetical protein TSOC_009832 [Tetrabaena socialis]|eukprot:PNH04052.1 hypothetical protein TSOC_009832 [Tetrabaena socialis]
MSKPTSYAQFHRTAPHQAVVLLERSLFKHITLTLWFIARKAHVSPCRAQDFDQHQLAPRRAARRLQHTSFRSRGNPAASSATNTPSTASHDRVRPYKYGSWYGSHRGGGGDSRKAGRVGVPFLGGGEPGPTERLRVKVRGAKAAARIAQSPSQPEHRLQPPQRHAVLQQPLQQLRPAHQRRGRQARGAAVAGTGAAAAGSGSGSSSSQRSAWRLRLRLRRRREVQVQQLHRQRRRQQHVVQPGREVVHEGRNDTMRRGRRVAVGDRTDQSQRQVLQAA